MDKFNHGYSFKRIHRVKKKKICKMLNVMENESAIKKVRRKYRAGAKEILLNSFFYGDSGGKSKITS